MKGDAEGERSERGGNWGTSTLVTRINIGRREQGSAEESEEEGGDEEQGEEEEN